MVDQVLISFEANSILLIRNEVRFLIVISWSKSAIEQCLFDPYYSDIHFHGQKYNSNVVSLVNIKFMRVWEKGLARKLVTDMKTTTHFRPQDLIPLIVENHY